jgi:hypothetical protein
MAQQNIEATDKLNQGKKKINENFTELYETPIKSGVLTEDVFITGQNEIYFGQPFGEEKLKGLYFNTLDPDSDGTRQAKIYVASNNFSQGFFAQAQSGFNNSTLEFTPSGLAINVNGVNYIAVPANGTEGQVLKWISGAPQWVTEGGGGG